MQTYTPTQWQTGDIITAEKLNHLEDGVHYATPKLATGVIGTNATSVTVSYTGDFIACYSVQGTKEVITDRTINNNSVVFTVAEKPSTVVNCYVLYV